MKKNIAFMLTLLFTASTVLYTGCKKDEDEVPPVVTLKGSNPMYVQVNKTFNDPGATAMDDVDGALTANASGTVNTSQTGTYTVTYTAIDGEGNVGTATRTVYVVNFDGTYQVTEVCDVTGSNSGPATVNASNATLNNGMTIANFALAGTNVVANATFDGTTITIPSQTIGSATYSGSGTITGTSQIVFNITYTTVVGTDTQTCQATYTKL